MQKTILIIEDDPKITDLIRLYCEQDGFRVISSASGAEGLELATKGQPDCVILDRMLPEMEGMEVLKGIRKTSHVPVILVTAKADEMERILGLELGADDYVAKPFSPKELMARVKAVLRRSVTRAPEQEVIQWKDLVIDPQKMSILQGSKRIECSAMEFKLLQAMANQPGRVFSREELIDLLHDSYADIVLDRTIDAHVKNLRKKLGDNPKKPTYIQSVFGVGYKCKEEE